MKRQTRDELAAECERLRSQNTVLSHAVDFLLNRIEPDTIEAINEEDGGRYAYQVFDVCAPHGGILLITYSYPGQRPSTWAHYLERYASEARRNVFGANLEHRCAVERLQRRAHALQRAHYGIGEQTQ